MEISSQGIALRGHLARPSGAVPMAGQALVICPGWPSGPRDGSAPGSTYQQLADHLAELAGWTVLAVDLRGVGCSGGDFSPAGWMADVRAAIGAVLALPGVAGAWLAGFNVGGSLAVCAAGEDERVGGVASLGAPADFGDWAADPVSLLEAARALGMVTTPGLPPDFDSWSRELSELRPLALVAKVPPRPLLIVHGADDDVVPLVDARALADAAEGEVDLRVLPGAGHHLRHDPRALAVLVGWLERMGGPGRP